MRLTPLVRLKPYQRPPPGTAQAVPPSQAVPHLTSKNEAGTAGTATPPLTPTPAHKPPRMLLATAPTDHGTHGEATMARSAPVLDKPLYRISEAVQLLPYSRSKLYELINAGRIRTVKEGGTRLITAHAIAEYVALLEREAGAA